MTVASYRWVLLLLAAFLLIAMAGCADLRSIPDDKPAGDVKTPTTRFFDDRN